MENINVFLPFFLFTSDYALNFREKGIDDVVKISGMPSLTDFTVCLWMSSSDNEGSPLSYAVSGQDNELAIFFKKYLQLIIGGAVRLSRYYFTSTKKML